MYVCLCTCVCVCVCVCACMWYINIHTYIHTSKIDVTSLFIVFIIVEHTYICNHDIYTYVCKYVFANVHVCMLVCI